MQKINPLFPLLFVVLAAISACQKSNNNPTFSNTCRDFTVMDSLTPSWSSSGDGWMYQEDAYVFNNDSTLSQHLLYGVGGYDTIASTIQKDTFVYSNGDMVKSYFILGGGSSTDYYTRSEYDYTYHLLTASRYYLGNMLMVHSTYTTDATGRITAMTQYSDNSTYQYTPTISYVLNYDSSGNLLQVTVNGNVYYEFTGYDNHPNPWYKIPFDFAYNVFDYSPRVFSKDNYGTAGGGSLSYNYSYRQDGKIANFTTTNHYYIVGYPCTK